MRFGIATRQQITQYRKHIWFTAFVLGAFLSPPDPLSLFLVAMPVVVLFELAMMTDRLIKISNA
jgi:sec-independent protein translocase protein TatC